jgi:hypothetical protein
VLPSVTDGFAGVTTIDESLPLPMVKVVVPFKPKAEAVMVTLPTRLPKAKPELRTDANLGEDDFHETPARLLVVLPSL